MVLDANAYKVEDGSLPTISQSSFSLNMLLIVEPYSLKFDGLNNMIFLDTIESMVYIHYILRDLKKTISHTILSIHGSLYTSPNKFR